MLESQSQVTWGECMDGEVGSGQSPEYISIWGPPEEGLSKGDWASEETSNVLKEAK